MKAGRRLLAILFAAGAAADSLAADPVRAQEIAECRPGEMLTWPDGQDRPAIASPLLFAYDPSGAPAAFPADLVGRLLDAAIAAWSPCGVPTRRVAWPAEAAARPVLVLWNEEASGGNFGLANLGLRRLALSARAFADLRTRAPGHDAAAMLQMALSHEIGHFFGLTAHSRRCVDVMSYYHDGRGGRCYLRNPAALAEFAEYRSTLPTSCDIERCRKVNNISGRE